MKNLYFYELELGKKKFIRSWVNWTGEVPEKGDVVIIHFGDYNEEEFMYRVVFRVFNGLRPERIDIIVEEIEKGGLTGMLALSRKKGEALVISNNIEVTILEIKGDQVKVGITAPREVPVYRKEIYLQIQDSNKAATDVSGMDALKDLLG